MKYYRIPTNYAKTGKIFRGMIAKRSLVDAIVLGVIGYFLASLLPLEGDAVLSGYILIVGLFAIIGIVGIQGIPVSVYVVDWYKWTKRKKRPYLYNNHGGAYTVSSADLMLNEPQFRDTLADALDRMKAAMASKQPEYIEGETFEFADDPELLALKAAQEAQEEDDEDDESDEEYEQEEQTPGKTAEHTEKVSAVKELNISGALGNLSLEDFEGGSDDG